MQKLECHRSGAGEITAVLRQDGAHVLGCAGFVIGRALDDERDPTGAITFVGIVLVNDPGEVAGAFGDGAIDVIDRHVLGFGLEDDRAQLCVGGRIAATGFGRQGEVAREATENLPALGVIRAFGALDGGPLTMT